MKLLICSLGLLFSTPFVVFCQSVKGTITDTSSGEVLIGASLYLKSDWRKGTSTDVNGQFSLEGIDIGDTLMVSYIGYREQLYIITDLQHIQIDLEPVVMNMTEVVVEAEYLVAEEFTYKKVNRLDIYMNPSAKADPLLAVNSLPSSTTLDESANISFRGSSPAGTGIFFNNVPIYDPVRFSQLNGIGTFGIFNTAIVDEMLVFPGNPPLEYGNTTSGLIAIKTTEEIPETASNTVTLSPASFGFMTSRPLGDKNALAVFSNYQPSGILKAMNASALEDIESFRSADLGINFMHRFNETSVFKLFNYSLTEGYDFNYQSPTFNGTFRQNKRRNFTVANFRKKTGRSQFTLNSNTSFSNAEFGFADMDIAIDNFDVFFSANYQYRHSKFNAKTGITVDYRNQRFEGTYYTFDHAEGPGFPTTTSEGTNDINRPELYLYTKYYPRENVVLGGGIRKNLPGDGQRHYLSGQLNVKVEPGQATSLIVAWGKYHKYALPQNDTETSFLIESDQISADLNWKKDRLRFSSSLFGKRTRDHAGTTELIGFEAFVSGNLTPKLSGQLSYTLINGTTTTKEKLEYPAAYDLNYFIRGNLNYQFSGYWSVNGMFIFREGPFHRPVTGASFDPSLEVFEPTYAAWTEQQRRSGYSTVDLSFNRLIPVREKLSIIVFGTCNNILNIKNIRTYTYDFDYTTREAEYFSRRTVYFGAVINF